MSDKEEKEIDVRIIPNRKDKRKFKKVHLKIPQVKEVSVMKEMLLNICGKDFANGNPTNVEIGYIGYSNRKYQIQNEKELLKGFESWQEHATECPLFYIVEAEAKPEVLELDSDSDNCIPASKKQKKEDTNKTTKRKKAASREAKKEEIVSNLEEKHGTQWEKREYRLWAEAILREDHDDYDKPPDYPVFNKKADKALKRTPCDLQAKTTRVETRTKLFEQLSMLKELKDRNILSESKYDEEKIKIESDLQDM